MAISNATYAVRNAGAHALQNTTELFNRLRGKDTEPLSKHGNKYGVCAEMIMAEHQEVFNNQDYSNTFTNANEVYGYLNTKNIINSVYKDEDMVKGATACGLTPLEYAAGTQGISPSEYIVEEVARRGSQLSPDILNGIELAYKSERELAANKHGCSVSVYKAMDGESTLHPNSSFFHARNRSMMGKPDITEVFEAQMGDAYGSRATTEYVDFSGKQADVEPGIKVSPSSGKSVLNNIGKTKVGSKVVDFSSDVVSSMGKGAQRGAIIGSILPLGALGSFAGAAIGGAAGGLIGVPRAVIGRIGKAIGSRVGQQKEVENENPVMDEAKDPMDKMEEKATEVNEQVNETVEEHNKNQPLIEKPGNPEVFTEKPSEKPEFESVNDSLFGSGIPENAVAMLAGSEVFSETLDNMASVSKANEPVERFELTGMEIAEDKADEETQIVA